MDAKSTVRQMESYQRDMTSNGNYIKNEQRSLDGYWRQMENSESKMAAYLQKGDLVQARSEQRNQENYRRQIKNCESKIASYQQKNADLLQKMQRSVQELSRLF